jgi:hypothetical protein
MHMLLHTQLCAAQVCVWRPDANLKTISHRERAEYGWTFGGRDRGLAGRSLLSLPTNRRSV